MEKAIPQTEGFDRTTILSAEFSRDYADALRQVADAQYRQNLLVVVIAEPGDTFPVGFSRTPYPMKYNHDYQAVRAAGQSALGYSPENLGPRDYEEEGIYDRTVQAGHVGCLIIHSEQVKMGAVRDLAHAALNQTVRRKPAGKAKASESDTAA